MAANIFKTLLPNYPVTTCVWCGPFRGARIVLNPRHSLRKIFGVYENELNSWLTRALQQVTRVVDVGANDGYFTFGCGAALNRLGKRAEVIAIEGQGESIVKLQTSIAAQRQSGVIYQLVKAYAGRDLKPGWVTLDSLQCSNGNPNNRTNTLIKIDVEGAEVEVIKGGRSWINSSNCFVIEVHEERYLAELSVLFAENGHRLRQINQSPLPLFGREIRNETNWWLVSDISGNR